jgi:hypothetical protein
MSTGALVRTGLLLGMGGVWATVNFMNKALKNASILYSGYQISCYESSVSDTHVDYMLPSENGNRSDVRWFSLTDKNGVGLQVSSVAFEDAPTSQLLHFSVHDYSALDLMCALTPLDLAQRKSRAATYVTVDAHQMGLGGNDSWSRAHLSEYLISPGHYTYSVQLNPVFPAVGPVRPPPLSPIFVAPAQRALMHPSYRPPALYTRVLALLKQKFLSAMANLPNVAVEHGGKFARSMKGLRGLMALALLLLLFAKVCSG